jgi:hypothetical protein
MVAGETTGPSGTRPDRYFDDISADELSGNAPVDETNDEKNADVNATRSGTNGADIFENPSLYGIS